MSNELLDLEDKARLEFTIRTRETIIRTLLKDGIPNHTGDKVLLAQALDGIDRTILAKTKIKADDKAAQTQQNTVKLISDILSRVTVNNSGKRVEPLETINYEILDRVDGETQEGIERLNYETFMR
jgi:hypothetical protein